MTDAIKKAAAVIRGHGATWADLHAEALAMSLADAGLLVTDGFGAAHPDARVCPLTGDVIDRHGNVIVPAGAPHVVVGDDHIIEIHWPGPRHESFQMSSDLFASMVDEINSYRRKATA